MKRIFILLLIVGFTASLLAQEHPCPPNGIITNPDNSVNNLHPDYRNVFFDWTKEVYDVDFGLINEQGNPYSSNNAGVYHLYNTGDYQPADGWELLYVDFGLDKLGEPLPSGSKSGHLIFILYNKYRSIVRIFVAIDEKDQNNLCEIELSMEGSQYTTAVLGSVDKVQQPLKSFDPLNVASNTQKYTTSTDNNVPWHYADFPVNYDPCTCEAPPSFPAANSLMHFKVHLIEKAKIELNGFSSGKQN